MKRGSAGERDGFTLIELLVVVAIIAILVAILLPALNTARGKARQAICMGNLKQISMAFIHYTDDFDGYLPPLGYRNGETFLAHWPGLLVMNGYLPKERGDTLRSYYREPGRVFRCPSLQIDENVHIWSFGGYSLPAYNDGISTREWGFWYHDFASLQELPDKIDWVVHPSQRIMILDGMYWSAVFPQWGGEGGGPNLVYVPLDGYWGAIYWDDPVTKVCAARRHSGGANCSFVDGHVEWFDWDFLRAQRTREGLFGPDF